MEGRWKEVVLADLGGHNLCPKSALTTDLKVPIKRANLKIKSRKKDLFNGKRDKVIQ